MAKEAGASHINAEGTRIYKTHYGKWLQAKFDGREADSGGGLMARQRRRYDDKFRASAVVMLEAAGYPDREGALTQTANHLGIPLNTLKGWFTAEHNPPPAKLRNKKRLELKELLRNEIDYIFDTMPNVRPDASYRDLGTVAGILFDKLQLLEGKPTLIVELTQLLKDGAITPEDILNEFADDPEAAEGLFESIGLRAVEVREAQIQSESTTSS